MSSRRPPGHPSSASSSYSQLGPLGTRLYGARIMLRPLVPNDFPVWTDLRLRNEAWLLPWEPQRLGHLSDPTRDREAFSSRCAARDRERQVGTAYGFGLFVDSVLVGEVNLNNVIRGAMQSGTVGYWIDRDRAGNRYVAEAVVVLARFAFQELRLHRIEICIVPRNSNSRRVMEVLQIREEGVAQRYLEIAGVWEDHVRYGLTVEEWHERLPELSADWL
jgi:[ribosomal protein S5]-alanine N-acetyltransferase